jgi:hypothetical protein
VSDVEYYNCVVDGKPVVREETHYSCYTERERNTIRQNFRFSDANRQSRYVAKANAFGRYNIDSIKNMFRCPAVCYFFDKMGNLEEALNKTYSDYMNEQEVQEREKTLKKIEETKLDIQQKQQEIKQLQKKISELSH